MLTYKAMYKFLDDGVHGEILDFPGVLTCGKDLTEARRLLSFALVDMAETTLLKGESMPAPNSLLSDEESDLEEPIYLILNASTKIRVVAEELYETA
ncbi:MAG: type II toxin-antitoxin system HicB family antitoxin [Acidobacteriota bacterium]|jgi:predicted RNase H-like HicB family nuclease|nr:type II toxin-antitoxin system HicB family antitoxin [Acidobacteriota bacterium]